MDFIGVFEFIAPDGEAQTKQRKIAYTNHSTLLIWVSEEVIESVCLSCLIHGQNTN